MSTFFGVRSSSNKNQFAFAQSEICSLRSTMTSRASDSRFPFTMTIAARGRRRSCAASRLSAVCRRAPASLHGFTMARDGWPFADSARDSDAVGSRMIWFQENHFGSP